MLEQTEEIQKSNLYQQVITKFKPTFIPFTKDTANAKKVIHK